MGLLFLFLFDGADPMGSSDRVCKIGQSLHGIQARSQIGFACLLEGLFLELQVLLEECVGVLVNVGLGRLLRFADRLLRLLTSHLTENIPYISKEIDLTRFVERCYLQSGDIII